MKSSSALNINILQYNYRMLKLNIICSIIIIFEINYDWISVNINTNFLICHSVNLCVKTLSSIFKCCLQYVCKIIGISYLRKLSFNLLS